MSIQTRFRKDYDGEFVVTGAHFVDGVRKFTREWVPNAIQNYHISGRAAVIGTQVDLEQFDYKRLQRHRGGLLGKLKLQTYGSGTLWRDMVFDFFLSSNKKEMADLVSTEYDSKSTVYSNAPICLTYPGRLYLIPNITTMDPAALAVYLAAFDEHKEIFLLGYSNSAQFETSHAIADVSAVMSAYTGTNFILVGTKSDMPDSWRSHRHVRCMSYREFVSYCDV